MVRAERLKASREEVTSESNKVSRGVFLSENLRQSARTMPTIPQMEYLKIHWSVTERQDVYELAQTSQSFYQNVMVKKTDLTKTIKDEMSYMLNGRIPRNFILNVRGLIGNHSGVFKSSLGIQLAMELDPTFNVKERLAFTANDLNDKLKQFADRKQIFVLDETLHDLKQSAEMRLANIAESCREKQICLILIGIPERTITFSTYWLERFGESADEFLPKKTVYYLLRKVQEGKKFYRGYIKHNIIQLNNPVWRDIWDEYMIHKSVHQERVIEQQVTAFDFERHAKDLFKKYKNKSNAYMTPKGKIDKPRVKNIILKEFSDITNQERASIQAEFIAMLEKHNSDD
jgi:hypothetical protein